MGDICIQLQSILIKTLLTIETKNSSLLSYQANEKIEFLPTLLIYVPEGKLNKLETSAGTVSFCCKRLLLMTIINHSLVVKHVNSKHTVCKLISILYNEFVIKSKKPKVFSL